MKPQLAAALLLCTGFLTLRAPAQEITQGERAAKLAADIISPDAVIRREARRNLINGDFRDLTDEQRFRAILSVIEKPVDDPHFDEMQGLLVEALPRLTGSQARQAIPLLLSYISDPKVDSYLRGKSMEAAALILPPDERVVAALIREAGGDGSPEIFRDAVIGLGRMGAVAKSARPTLINLVNKRSGEVPYLAFISLGQILLQTSGETDFIAKAGLLTASPDERSAGHLQLRTARETKKLTPAAAVAARATLLNIIQRKVDDADTHAALETLRHIGAGSDPAMIQAIFANATDYFGSNAMMAVDFSNDAQVPVLVNSLRTAMSVQTDWVMRSALANGLSHYGRKGSAIAPELIATLEKDLTSAHPDWLVSESYLHLLAALGADVPDVSAAFIRLLDHVPPKNRDGILVPFFDAGLPTDPNARKTVLTRMIQELNGDEFAALRPRLINKMPAEDLQPYAETFVPKLQAVLTRAEPADEKTLQAQLDECREAVQALGHLGTAAISTKPLLQEIAAHEMSPLMYSMTEMKRNALSNQAREVLKSPPFTP